MWRLRNKNVKITLHNVYCEKVNLQFKDKSILKKIKRKFMQSIKQKIFIMNNVFFTINLGYDVRLK